MALEQCQTYFSASVPQQFEPGKEFYSTGVQRSPGEKFEKLLLAYNVGTGSIAWRYPQTGPGCSSGGTMTTAGGIVFFGDDAQSFEAVDAHDGKPLWHFATGQDISASPMTYAVDGKHPFLRGVKFPSAVPDAQGKKHPGFALESTADLKPAPVVPLPSLTTMVMSVYGPGP